MNKIYIIIGSLLVAVNVFAENAGITLKSIKLEEMLYEESLGTVLESNELVAISDELPSSKVLKLGNGQTVGGNYISDPNTVRVSGTRELNTGEYVVMPSPGVMYTNSTWVLLTNRVGTSSSDRECSITIISDYRISSVSYSLVTSNTVVITPNLEFGLNQVQISASEDVPVSNTNDLNICAYLSNLKVEGFKSEYLIGTTNDLRSTYNFVRGLYTAEGTTSHRPLLPDEPLAFGVFTNSMYNNYAEDWWRYVALGDVRLNSKSLYLSPKIDIKGNSTGYDITYELPNGDTRGIAETRFTGTSYTNAYMSLNILDYDLDSDPIKIWVESYSQLATNPVIQHAEYMNGSWTNLPTTSTWPDTEEIIIGDETYVAWLLEAPDPGSGSFRVAVVPGTNIVDEIEYKVRELRNLGHIGTDTGFKVGDIEGVTTNITITSSTTNVLHFVGGLFVGASDE